MFILYNCCLGLEASATDIDLSTNFSWDSSNLFVCTSFNCGLVLKWATRIYTPSKTLPVIQNYRLNVRKAAEKLIDATSRPHDTSVDTHTIPVLYLLKA
jgi:hypothetical protein